MKNFFKKIWNILTLIFTDPNKWIDKNVLPSIEIVQNIKLVLDGAIGIAITTIIPGTWDDSLRTAFSRHLGIVIDLFVSKKGNPSLDTKLKKLVELLSSLTPTARAGIYAKIASRLAIANAGQDAIVKNNAVDLLTQAAYTKLKSSINFDEVNDENNEVEKMIIPKL